MKETRIYERDDGTIQIRRIGASGKWATSTPELVQALIPHISAIAGAMDSVTPDEDLAIDRAKQQAVEQAKAAAEAKEKAALAEKEKADAVQALLELSEMLYGDGTDTPLPDVPDPTQPENGATP